MTTTFLTIIYPVLIFVKISGVTVAHTSVIYYGLLASFLLKKNSHSFTYPLQDVKESKVHSLMVIQYTLYAQSKD